MLGLIAAALILLFLVFLPQKNRQEITLLERIQATGELRVLTINSPSTYYESKNGLSGLEFDLVQRFAEQLGVTARFIVLPHQQDVIPELLFGSGDLAAAGLSVLNADISDTLLFGPRYQTVSEQLVYRKGTEKPKTLEDLQNQTIEVIAGTSQHKLMRELQLKYPALQWNANDNKGIEELLESLHNRDIDFVVSDSHQIALQRRFFPELRIAMTLNPHKELAWAMAASHDDSLLLEMNRFFAELEQNGTLTQLLDRYYAQVENFNYSDLQTFEIHRQKRLPKYQALFQRVAQQEALDWNLLAAIGYQESLWNERATSPTGVRGLMMLTQSTAKQMKISNRLDPEQSIIGGARYLKRVKKKIPQRITEPDRTWMALASYNVGFGHLEDARILTQKQGGDPDKWIDVKKRLPLLSQKKWYSQTKYGYARGSEPVTYVENIRKYIDLLQWHSHQGQEKTPLSAPDRTPTLPPSF